VTFLKSNGRRIPVPANSIDFLFSLLVLQHLDRTDVRHLVREFGKVLKPSGRCYLQLPEYGDLVDRGANTRPWTVKEVQVLLREWSILSLEREAGASGFVNIWVVAQPKGKAGSSPAS
jgi:SAM-dependent methyltransferase